MTEFTDHGPSSGEILRQPSKPGRVWRLRMGVIIPILASDLFFFVILLAILRRGVSATPVVLWVFLAVSLLAGALLIGRVVPGRYRRIRAETEGRAGTYRVRLARGDWVWSLSGFGGGGIESIVVGTYGASGEPDPGVSGPEVAAWCLDTGTGTPIGPSRSVRGRDEDRSGWAFGPPEGVEPLLFLTIDRGAADAPGAWDARITVICARGSPPESLMVQRLTPDEASGLRPVSDQGPIGGGA